MNATRSICALALAAACASASGQSFTFQVFENDDGVSTAGLEVNLSLIDGGDYVDFFLTNNSTIGGVATMFLFENSNVGLEDCEILPTGVGADWDEGSSSRNPPGSIALFSGPWSGTLFNAEANPSPMTNGLHAGESLGLRFELDDTSYDDVVSAVRDQDMRLVTHIQGLGDSSVWSVSVPTPATFGLFAIAGIAALSHRRR